MSLYSDGISHPWHLPNGLMAPITSQNTIRSARHTLGGCMGIAFYRVMAIVVSLLSILALLLIATIPPGPGYANFDL